MSEGRYVQDRDRPIALMGTAEWSSRTPAGMSDSPVELAARIEAALDAAERLMFAVTPVDELDVAARWQLAADQAWCGQLRHVVATTCRLSPQDRDFAGDEFASPSGCPRVQAGRWCGGAGRSPRYQGWSRRSSRAG